MRMTLSLLFVSLTTACVADPADTVVDDTGSAASDVRVNPATDLVEPAYVNGVKCSMIFKGALTPQTEMYQIWAVGTNGVVDGATYNTPRRPNLYAVFGTGSAPSDTHHVDGFSQFDHYHILDNAHGTDVDNRTWDLLALFPGPNFNAATYRTAHSVTEMLAQSARGELSGVLTTTDIGFPPVVLNFPVNCPRGHY